MARCTAGVLRGAIVVLGAAAGNIYGRLVVFNAGQECTLFGFSGLQLVDANGTVLPTNAVWDLPPAPSLVTLPNNGLAVANLHPPGAVRALLAAPAAWGSRPLPDRVPDARDRD